MKSLFKTAIITILLFTLLPFYTFAANNGPMDPIQYDDYTYDVAYICTYNPLVEGSYVGIFSEHKANNKAIEGATYDLKTNTLTLKNFRQPKLTIEVNAMGEDFKIKLVGTNKIGALNVWGDGWGGSIQFIGTGNIEINKNKTNKNAINLYGEYSKAALKIAKTVTVKIWAKTNLMNANFSTVSTAAKVIVLENGQKISVKKAQSYYESYKRVMFRLDEETCGAYPVMKDSKGTEYVVLDFYIEEPTEIYTLNEKDSKGYYTGKKASVEYDDLTYVIIKEKVKGCYNYIVKGTSIEIPAGSSPKTIIKKLTSKKKGFTIGWDKKSVTIFNDK